MERQKKANPVQLRISENELIKGSGEHEEAEKCNGRGDIMGITYHCFQECNNSLAMYILTAGYGFMKTIKEVMRVAEAGSEQWKGFQLRER